MPRVSIVIPTYNRRQYLQRAIDSVTAQVFTDFELLIVDDASTDDTASFVESFSDRRIRYHRHDVNRGAPAARNTGLRLATGEFVAFLDSDNEWLPQRIEKQVELFSRLPDSVGVVYANNKVLNEINHTETVWAFGLRGNLYKEFLRRPFIDFITPLIRKSCFDKIGMMDENVPSYQEWDTFLRLAKHYEFEFVPEVLAVYYIHPHDRISRDALREAEGWQYVFDKHRAEMLSELRPRVLVEHYRNLAHLYRRGHDYVRMTKYLALFSYYRMFS